MYDQKELESLFDKFFHNCATEDEKNKFFGIVDDISAKSDIENIMKEHWNSFVPKSESFSEIKRDEMLMVILNWQKKSNPTPIRRFKIWRYIAATAAIILMASTVLVYYYLERSPETAHYTVSTDEIVPGKIGATLTLANGKKIKLSDITEGQLAHEAGVMITKSADGHLVYEIKESGNEGNQFNTLSTAKGETYQVHLPDGSLVWLNAASSLTYPVNLMQLGKRSVKLVGEAYFEIASNPTKPFVVESKGQDIEVLGTKFNVNAYPNDQTTTTTLFSGSVRLNKKHMLRPGYKAILNNNVITIEEADLQAEIDWKNGRFTFSGRDFKSLMHQIERWYNVEVVYDYNPVNLRIAGGVSRFESLKDLLDLIEETGDVRFKIEGRRVIVMK